MAVFGNIIRGGTNVNAPPGNNKAVSQFVLDRQGTIDHLLFDFYNSSGSDVKAVIYDNSGVGGLPGALLATSSLVSVTGINPCAFPFSSGPTLNAGTYWAGLIATSGGTTNCRTLSNGIAYNSDTIAGGPSNPFGSSPNLANFAYPLLVYYTPVLPVGTAYGQLLGGDSLNHANLGNAIVAMQINIPVAGSISKLTTFYQDTYSSAKCKGVIYDSTGPSGGPGNLLGVTNELIGPVINGNDLLFASPINVAAGNYYIGVHTDTNLFAHHLNDSTPNAVGTATYTSGTPGTFPSSPTLSTGSWILWATFTAAVIPNSGLITITGYAPTLAQTANQTIAATVGAVSITGYAPTVIQASAPISLTPDPGAITIVGYAPSVAQSDSQSSGGFFEVPQVPRRRTVREERERLGIFPREVKRIAIAVARASVVADKTDDQAERQLAARLAQQDIDAQARYTAFMQAERDRILARDIERALLIRRRQLELDEDERDAEMLLM